MEIHASFGLANEIRIASGSEIQVDFGSRQGEIRMPPAKTRSGRSKGAIEGLLSMAKGDRYSTPTFLPWERVRALASRVRECRLEHHGLPTQSSPTERAHSI